LAALFFCAVKPLTDKEYNIKKTRVHMFNWLKNLFFGKPAQKVQAPVVNDVFEKEAVSMADTPHIEPVAETPKPKKKRYYKPKAKKTETPAPAKEAKPRNRKGPESK
jgi:hypothetical protein